MRKAVILLLTLGLAAAGGLELYARRTAHLDALVYQDSLDPALRFELRAGAAGMKAGSWVKINSDGLREREIPRAKSAGEFRVLVVGDEPAFGLGLGEDETFVRRLEKRLRPPPGSRLVTVNLSMYHYDWGQELELLKTKGLSYAPDVIVFETQMGKPLLPRVRYDFPRLKNLLRQHSVFMRCLMEGAFWARPAAPGHPDPESAGRDVGLLASAVKKLDIPTLLVVFPDLTWDWPRDAAARRDLERYRRASAAFGLAYYDVSEALGPGPWRRYRIDGQSWPNAAAEEAAAAGMAPAIQRLISRRVAAGFRLKPATPKL